MTHDRAGRRPPTGHPTARRSRTRQDRDGDVSNIFVVDLATGETSQVTHEKPTTETCLSCPQGAAYPQFSSAGTSIVYEVHRGGEVDVRIVRVTGGKSVLLVDGTSLGTLSPDGSMFVVGCGAIR